jgi:hypothetical protein
MKTRKLLADKARTTRNPTQEEISQLAYAIYEREGKPEGKAMEHWLNAEAITARQHQ